MAGQVWPWEYFCSWHATIWFVVTDSRFKLNNFQTSSMKVLFDHFSGWWWTGRSWYRRRPLSMERRTAGWLKRKMDLWRPRSCPQRATKSPYSSPVHTRSVSAPFAWLPDNPLFYNVTLSLQFNYTFCGREISIGASSMVLKTGMVVFDGHF